MAAQFTSIQSQLTALQTAITKNAINGGASGAAGGTSSQTSTTTNSTTSATDTQLAQAITNQTKAMQQMGAMMVTMVANEQSQAAILSLFAPQQAWWR